MTSTANVRKEVVCGDLANCGIGIHSINCVCIPHRSVLPKRYNLVDNSTDFGGSVNNVINAILSLTVSARVRVREHDYNTRHLLLDNGHGRRSKVSLHVQFKEGCIRGYPSCFMCLLSSLS